MSMRMTCVALAVGTIITSVSSYAQEAASVNLGKFKITPRLNTQLSFVENVANMSTTSSEPLIDSWRLVTAPKITASTRSSTSVFRLSARVEDGHYFSSESDSYTDFFIDYESVHYVAEKQTVTLALSHESGHDERGQVYTIGRPLVIDSPDTYKLNIASAMHSLGSNVSTARIDTEFRYEVRDYDLDTAPIFNRDRKTPKLKVYGKYKIGLATSLVGDLRVEKIMYDGFDTAASLDSIRSSLQVGLAWDATEFLDGRATIGYEKRDFDSNERIDYSGFDWLVDLKWTPLVKTQFRLISESDSQETNGNGDYMDEQSVTVSWAHEWYQWLTSRIELGYIQRDFVGVSTNNSLREEELTNIQFNIGYRINRWLRVSNFYQFGTRNSSQSSAQFDRQAYGIGLEVSL